MANSSHRSNDCSRWYLFSFPADNWNNARLNQALATTYMSRIESELELQHKLLQRSSDYFTTARVHAVSALNGFSGSADTLDQQFLVDLYQASQIWFVAFSNSAYEELQSTGKIAILKDPELRTVLANHSLRLSALDYTLKSNSEYRREARLRIHNDVQKEIRSQCGDIWVTDKENYYYVSLPPTCDIDLPAELVAAEIRKLHSDNALLQELRFHLSVLDAQLGTLGNTANITKQTLLTLQQAQD